MMQHKRPLVLHVRGVTGAGGGPEKTILNSPRFLQELGYDAICAYMHPPADPGFAQLQARGVELGAQVASIEDRGPLDRGVFRRLLALCREVRPDIWHGHDYKSNLLGLVLRRWVPMRLVTTVHGWVHYTPRTRLYYRIDKACLRRYEQIYCVSEDLQQECLRFGAPAERCFFVPNGIDAAQFQRRQAPSAARAAFAAARPAAELATAPFTLGALGRLSPEKGFDRLIRAVQRLLDSGRDLQLWIGGDGAERARLQTQIDATGHADRIRLLGLVERPREFFETLDLFVLSSLREGLPNVVLEAMAVETPLVATRVAGVPRVVEDGATGLLIDPADDDALTAAIARMHDDAALRFACAAAARRKVETDFSFCRRMETIVAHYDRLLGRQASALAPAMEASP